MLGAPASIALTNVMLNTAVAESLSLFADELENANDFESALHDLLRRTIHDHRRVIFNGNGYDEAWVREATEVRGLHNLRTTPDCVPKLLDRKNIDLFVKHNIFTESELRSRCHIMLSNYCKVLNIEARTMIDMVRRDILPAISAYEGKLSSAANEKRSLSSTISCGYEEKLVRRLSVLADTICRCTDTLEDNLTEIKTISDVFPRSGKYRDIICPVMEELRTAVDEAETCTASEFWPFPTYGDLLFGVR